MKICTYVRTYMYIRMYVRTYVYLKFWGKIFVDFMNFLSNDKNLPQKFCYAIATIQYVHTYFCKSTA